MLQEILFPEVLTFVKNNGFRQLALLLCTCPAFVGLPFSFFFDYNSILDGNRLEATGQKIPKVHLFCASPF